MYKKLFFQTLSNNNLEFIYIENSNISYKEHNHISIYTIGILVSGELNLSLNGKSTLLKENDFYIISPYEPHSINTSDSYSLINICINKDFTQDSTFIDTTLQNFSLFLSKYFLPKYLLNSLSKIIKLIPKNTRHIPYDEYFHNIKNTIELYPENNISIQNIANRVFVSEYYTIRKFKNLYGLSPYKFQLQNRINKSKHLLINNFTITETAFLMGFCDQSHFIKQFKNIVGISPSKYKKSFI